MPALVGLAMMITIAPLQSWLGNKIGGIRKATTTVSDARVKLMTEILNGVRPRQTQPYRPRPAECRAFPQVKVVKMLGWEAPLAAKLALIRKDEVALQVGHWPSSNRCGRSSPKIKLV